MKKKQIAEMEAEEMSLESDIRNAINYHSAENKSDTPDFILAGYLIACLDAFHTATRTRSAWYAPEGDELGIAHKEAGESDG